ncbi:hypothetical protein Tco_0741432, partial [Tanacetum coccineum]
WAKEFHQDRASSVKVPVANFTLPSLVHYLATGISLGLVVLSVFSMLAACASRAMETLLATSFLMAA